MSKYYVLKDGHGLYELRQSRFKKNLLLGAEHEHDVCAVARSEEELRSMLAEVNWIGDVEWPKDSADVESRGVGLDAEQIAEATAMPLARRVYYPCIRGYLACAYFTDAPDGGDEVWTGEEEWADEAVDEASIVYRMFIEQNVNYLAQIPFGLSLDRFMYRLGMMIWYSRNGHGIGFQDFLYEQAQLIGRTYYDTELAEKLQDAARKLKECHVWNDNGKLRFE